MPAETEGEKREIMLLRVPEYYHQFQCIASACPDNCCIGWEIDIDQESAARYRETEVPFGDRLRAAIRREGETACFRLNGERCAMLNGDNLCEIILNLGEDALCQICRDHPRFTDTFGSLRETGVGLCCPEAARLLLSRQESLTFSVVETPETGEESECDPEVLSELLKARETLFRIVQDRTIPLTLRMDQALTYAAQLQGETFSEIPEPSEATETVRMWLSALAELERINELWTERLEAARILFNRSERDLKHLTRSFFAAAEGWAQEFEHLMMYFLFRYFLKAVYTGDCLTPVQLAVVSCLLIGVLELTGFAEQGSLSPEERAAAARLYSKQMEYSEENRETLEEWLIFDERFSVDRLRRILRAERK